MTRAFKILIPIVIIVAVLAVLVGAAWLFGPRTAVDTTVTFDAANIGTDLDAYLAKAEARVPGIQPNQHKHIVWVDPDTKSKTTIAIIYIHGFSASPGEMRPVPELVAKALGANLFVTRLFGHGTTTRAMVDTSVNAWVNDFAEAVAIGEQLGSKVVVIGASTGAALTTWAISRPAFRDRIAAVVLCSPNYRVQAFGSSLLTFPFARQLAHLVMGETRTFDPETDLQRLYWTTTYPVDALLPMAETVRLAANSPVEQIRIPALFLISAEDKVVDPDATRAMADRWGGPHRLVEVEGVEDPSMHVLAGEAMSPGTTVPVSEIMTEWLRETVGPGG